MGELHIDKERSKSIARVSIFISIAMMALPAIGWVIIPFDWKIPIDFIGIQYSSWRLYILMCSLPNVIASVILFKSPESPKFLKAMGRSEEALNVLKIMYETNHKGMKFQVIKMKYFSKHFFNFFYYLLILGKTSQRWPESYTTT